MRETVIKIGNLLAGVVCLGPEWERRTAAGTAIRSKLEGQPPLALKALATGGLGRGECP